MILLSEKKAIEPGIYTVNPKINVNKKPATGNLMTVYKLNEMSDEQLIRYNLLKYKKTEGFNDEEISEEITSA